jgi:hypothetical protein
MSITAPRAELSGWNTLPPYLPYYLVVGANNAVWTPGRGNNKVTLTGNLTVQGGKNLDGVLHNKVTLTGDLNVSSGTFLDGILRMKQTVIFADLYVPHFGGTARMRSVANIAVLGVGTTHMPSALLPMKWSANAILTVNYMRATLRTKWTAGCALSVAHFLAASAQMKLTPTVALTRQPGAQGGLAAVHWSGSARLTMPLAGILRNKITASAVPSVQRRFAGLAASRSSASLNLFVVRTLQASVGARQTAAATLTSVRALAAQAGMRNTASAGLTVARRLGGTASILWRAYLAVQPARPTLPPETDITVSPYTLPVDSETLPVGVESPSGTVHVEE